MVSTLDCESSDPSSNLGSTCVFYSQLFSEYIFILFWVHNDCFIIGLHCFTKHFLMTSSIHLFQCSYTQEIKCCNYILIPYEISQHSFLLKIVGSLMTSRQQCVIDYCSRQRQCFVERIGLLGTVPSTYEMTCFIWDIRNMSPHN